MKIRKILVPLLSLLIIGGLIYAAADAFADAKKEKALNEQARALTGLAGIRPDMDFHQKGDALRAFIQANSIHDTGEEFHSIWRDQGRIMDMLAAAARDPKAHRPPLECSTRSGVMVRMMNVLGYPAHSVAVYKPGVKPGQDMLSHTFTEEQNPQTGKWEVQDTDLDLFWRFKKDRSRAGAEDLLSHPLSELEPCRTETDCGYNRYEDRKAATYMNVMSIRDAANGLRPLIVNASRFDMNKKFEFKNRAPMTFCEWKKKDCQNEIRIYRDDNKYKNGPVSQ
jgi:hypothetical protein